MEEVPGWREWRGKKLKYTLFFDDIIRRDYKELEEGFQFPEDIEKKHKIVICFLSLADSVSALKDCEYYFRRYPFHGLPVSRQRHLVHMCEMYFGRFYEIRERIKSVLNAVNDCMQDKNLDIGKFIKLYDKVFSAELRARNRAHHHERFDDLETSRLFIVETASGKLKDISEKAARDEYRRVTRQWSKRVQKKSKQMDRFLEAVAQAIIENCDLRI
ncbi:hypothetical protein [Oricola nitratireducens]|uniref:hypothetical protein n=1 Tax=Oricola nitratireducens TaxID=2775868 RepID=UPI00186727D9|nr:hypothetical protein [Oricola nitratireducens]